MAGTTLFEHMSSMLWTTTPALVISLILYTVLGFTSASGGAVDTTTADLYIDNLSAHFNLSPVCLIPVVVLIVVIVKKAPAIPGLVVSALLGAVMAVIFQGSNPIDVANLMYDGFTIDTGVEQIDSLLNRGGISSMLWTVALYFMACILGNILDVTGMLRPVL